MTDEPTISTLEAAERLAMDPVEIYRMIDEGRLTASWIGDRLVVPAHEIDSLAHITR